jgi:hypothetical protein
MSPPCKFTEFQPHIRLNEFLLLQKRLIDENERTFGNWLKISFPILSNAELTLKRWMKGLGKDVLSFL